MVFGRYEFFIHESCESVFVIVDTVITQHVRDSEQNLTVRESHVVSQTAEGLYDLHGIVQVPNTNKVSAHWVLVPNKTHGCCDDDIQFTRGPFHGSLINFLNCGIGRNKLAFVSCSG